MIYKRSLLLPGYARYWEGLGRSLALQERFTEAILAFSTGLEITKKSYQWFYDHLIGQCYSNLNDFYRALAHYTKCLEAKPTYAVALNDKAALYFNQEGDMTNAIDYIKKAEIIAEKEQLAYTLQMVYLNLANIYKKLKEFELEKHYHLKFMNTIFGGLFTFGYDENGDDEEKNDDD